MDPESDFAKSESGVFKNSDIHQVFDTFRCWLYTGRLNDSSKDTSGHASREAHHFPVAALVDVWVFADMRGIPALGNANIDMFHKSFAATWAVCFKIIEKVYEDSGEQSCLNRFFVASYNRSRGVQYCLASLRKYKSFVVVDYLLHIVPDLMNRLDGKLRPDAPKKSRYGR